MAPLLLLPLFWETGGREITMTMGQKTLSHNPKVSVFVVAESRSPQS